MVSDLVLPLCFVGVPVSVPVNVICLSRGSSYSGAEESCKGRVRRSLITAECLPYLSSETQARYKLGRQLTWLHSSWFKPDTRLLLYLMLVHVWSGFYFGGFLWSPASRLFCFWWCLVVCVVVICLLSVFCCVYFPFQKRQKVILSLR